jgi:hypothetical protein
MDMTKSSFLNRRNEPPFFPTIVIDLLLVS